MVTPSPPTLRKLLCPHRHSPVTDRVGVVGGGILGVAVAREILKRRPDADVTLFEKEDRLASHQTGRNSGVVHAGLYYEPGSNKAVLCRRGVGLLEEFCEQRGIRRIACGKVLVALDEVERARLDNIDGSGHWPTVYPGVAIIGPEAVARAGAARAWRRRACTPPPHRSSNFGRGDTGAGRRCGGRWREDCCSGMRSSG